VKFSPPRAFETEVEEGRGMYWEDILGGERWDGKGEGERRRREVDEKGWVVRRRREGGEDGGGQDESSARIVRFAGASRMSR